MELRACSRGCTFDDKLYYNCYFMAIAKLRFDSSQFLFIRCMLRFIFISNDAIDINYVTDELCNKKTDRIQLFCI